MAKHIEDKNVLGCGCSLEALLLKNTHLCRVSNINVTKTKVVTIYLDKTLEEQENLKLLPMAKQIIFTMQSRACGYQKSKLNLQKCLGIKKFNIIVIENIWCNVEELTSLLSFHDASLVLHLNRVFVRKCELSKNVSLRFGSFLKQLHLTQTSLPRCLMKALLNSFISDSQALELSLKSMSLNAAQISARHVLLSQSTSLSKLNLTATDVTEDDVSVFLHHLASIAELNLSHCRSLHLPSRNLLLDAGEDVQQMANDVIAIDSSLTVKLKTLTLSFSTIRNDLYNSLLGFCSCFSSIDITNCKNLEGTILNFPCHVSVKVFSGSCLNVESLKNLFDSLSADQLQLTLSNLNICLDHGFNTMTVKQHTNSTKLSFALRNSTVPITIISAFFGRLGPKTNTELTLYKTEIINDGSFMISPYTLRKLNFFQHEMPNTSQLQVLESCVSFAKVDFGGTCFMLSHQVLKKITVDQTAYRFIELCFEKKLQNVFTNDFILSNTLKELVQIIETKTRSTDQTLGLMYTLFYIQQLFIKHDPSQQGEKEVAKQMLLKHFGLIDCQKKMRKKHPPRLLRMLPSEIFRYILLMSGNKLYETFIHRLNSK